VTTSRINAEYATRPRTIRQAAQQWNTAFRLTGMFHWGVSLLVHVFVLDADGKQCLLDTPAGCSDLAGWESWRTEVWGSAIVRQLGGRFLPVLDGGDLVVAADQVPDFLQECMTVRANLDLFPADPISGRSAQQQRDEISVRLANLQVAGGRALGARGGVIVW
jgi:hypothetical protein